MRAPYTVTLTQVDDGTIITQVGCKTIVFTSPGTLVSALARYFTDPELTIKEFSETHGWALAEASYAPPVGLVSDTETAYANTAIRGSIGRGL